MPSRKPLVVIDGRKSQLKAVDDFLPSMPKNITLNYSGTDLDTIVNSAGTKTFVYSGGKLSTISDTENGRLSTFNYTGDTLTGITVTTL